MPELVVIIAALTAGATGGAVYVWSHNRRVVTPVEPPERGWLDDVVRRRVLVHTRDGQTIDGHLSAWNIDGVVLSPATLADSGLDLAGHVFVPREQVAWLQQPPSDTDGK